MERNHAIKDRPVKSGHLKLKGPSLKIRVKNHLTLLSFPRYGTDVAAVTDAAFATAGNSYLTFYNTAALGPKGIAKRMAKVCIQGVGGRTQHDFRSWPGWKQPA
jgi:hypothetical protein